MQEKKTGTSSLNFYPLQMHLIRTRQGFLLKLIPGINIFENEIMDLIL